MSRGACRDNEIWRTGTSRSHHGADNLVALKGLCPKAGGSTHLWFQHSGSRSRQISVEFKTSLVYRESSRTARVTQRNPVSQNQKKGRKEGRQTDRQADRQRIKGFSLVILRRKIIGCGWKKSNYCYVLGFNRLKKNGGWNENLVKISSHSLTSLTSGRNPQTLAKNVPASTPSVRQPCTP